MACFADINASQGSVATYARCGGIFDIPLTANLPGNLPVRKVLKSVKNWQNCSQESVASFLVHPVGASYCGIDSLSHILIVLHRRIEVIAFDSGQSAFSYRLPAITDSRLSLRDISSQVLVPFSFSQFLDFVCTFKQLHKTATTVAKL